MKRHGALIGFGAIAEKGHWPAYAKASAGGDVEIVAVMEPSDQRRAAAHQLNADLRLYKSTEELFTREKLDFVDICTPPASHVGLTLQALGHGLHVLCEKPLVLSETDYAMLAKEQERAQKTVFAVHNWLYSPSLRQALAWIGDGRIGPAWHVALHVLRDNVCKGTAQGTTGASVAAENWRQDPSVSGGGILVDHGWHAFYMIMNLIGKEPQTVSARMRYGSDTLTSLDEEAQAEIQFPDAAASMHLTWRAPIRRNAIYIQGLNGTILLDDDRLVLNVRGQKLEEKLFPALSAGSHHADWFEALLPDFLRELEQKRGANFREAGWCAALTKAAYTSHSQGSKEVKVLFPVSTAPKK